MRSMVLLLVGMFVACGPSSAEIKMAKTASYAGDPAQIFAEVQAATAESYKIAETSTEGEYVLATEAQWYSPEGGRQSAGTGDFVQLSDRSVQLTMIVEVVAPSQDRIMVTVTPKTFQHVSGSPKPRELAPDDPNLPGFIHGRVETLQVAIHKRLQKYQVK